MGDAQRTNPRLANQGSAYLRGAAHQPVEWHPWGKEAFDEARRQDKPILLDVGAVWCHWCHVMDGESYEDPDLARLINERFVPVKVDRDERPDVDARYQRMVSTLTGQGGWPLTGFLTPDGDVFFGGTYFPPSDQFGRPSFRSVLESVADTYATRRADVLDQASKIATALRHAAQHKPKAAGAFSPEFPDQAVAAVQRHHDVVNGGWGHAPKFPHPSAVEFLIAASRHGADAGIRDLVMLTLERMGAGGVYDHVGGGFHRYGTDAAWQVPHFEKMLYDNAELMRNYVHAWRRWRSAEHKVKAADIVRFLDEVLSDRAHGGFYGSQDADVTFGDDGDYFTWTRSELEDTLGAPGQQARILELHFGVEDVGPMHHNRAKNVLHVAAEPDEIAAALKLPLDFVRREITGGLESLRTARRARKAPFVDPVLYTNWNAMAIRAYLEFAASFDRPDAARFALLTLDRFLREAYDEDSGFAHSIGGARVRGLLDDNAQMLVALIAAFNETQDASHLERARAVGDLLLREFWREDLGAFVDVGQTVHESEGLKPFSAPERPVQDAPGPSANARAAEGLLLLHDLTGDARYRDVVDRLLASTGPEALENGAFGAGLLLAGLLRLRGTTQVVVAGPAGDERLAELRRAALAHGPAGMTVLQATKAELPPTLPPEAIAFAEGPGGRRPAALVCFGNRCLAPASDPAALASQLRGL